MINKPKILLAGTGYMGMEYAKIMKAMGIIFTAVGRGQESAIKFEEKTGVTVISGGIEKWLKTNKSPSLAIVTTSEDQLGSTTRHLLKSGCKNILVEKPGGLNGDEIIKTAKEAKKRGANVYIGYNRRFYSSALKARELIKKDGGVKSFYFDFTERSNIIEALNKPDKIKKALFLLNSTHVIDLAFFLGGKPNKIYALKSGKLAWHPSGSVYVGAGVSDKKALFSYHADWESAGRWGVEIMTSKNKYIFQPLEKLRVQKYGSIAIEDYPLNDKLDMNFKPGLYLQVKAFLGDKNGLIKIEEQVKNLRYYKAISKGVSI